MSTFICYEKCSTCKKAEKWLKENNISHEVRAIKEHNPNSNELRVWQEKSGLPLKRFFNSSGQLYRSMELSRKLPTMTAEEQIALLALDGMLVKRPLYIDGDTVLVGFKETEWAEKLLK